MAAVLPLLFAASGRAAGPAFTRAEEQYQRADYRGAIATLASLPAKDAHAWALSGKALYMDGEYRKATACLEKAIAADPGSSEYYDWLGKAWGRRAEEANFLVALPYANKTRAAFEKAAALDATNLEALGDLFEYYLEAPGIAGGGIDKAEAVAAQIGRFDQAELHYTRFRLAEKRRDMSSAERELRIAMQLAPGQVGRVIDLARFLSQQGRYEESDRLFRRAAEMAPDAPKVVFARAAAYIESGRNLNEARALLRHYGELPITPDDPPRPEVTRLLMRASR